MNDSTGKAEYDKYIKGINKREYIYNKYIEEKNEREFIYNYKMGITDEYTDRYSRAWGSMEDQVDFSDICEYMDCH